ncbi:MAG TPA: hypothetical protein VF867_16645, partial [Arthrobacter sp.]
MLPFIGGDFASKILLPFLLPFWRFSMNQDPGTGNRTPDLPLGCARVSAGAPNLSRGGLFTELGKTAEDDSRGILLRET